MNATQKIDGIYRIGAELYFSDATLADQVLRADRRSMTAEQLAGLTRVRVVAAERRPCYLSDNDVEDGAGMPNQGMSTVEVMS